MTRITIQISEAEREALRKLALEERRDARNQASILLRQALVTKGFLPIEQPDQKHNNSGRGHQ